MNHIGTHDTMRAITALAGESCEGRDRFWQSGRALSVEQYENGVRLLKLAAAIQYTRQADLAHHIKARLILVALGDPFNRVCYPWGNENEALLAYYKKLGEIRKSCHCLKEGMYFTVSEMLSCLAFTRQDETDRIFVVINRNEHDIDYYLPEEWKTAQSLLGEKVKNGAVHLPALSAAILKTEVTGK